MTATTSELTFDVLKSGDLKDLAAIDAEPCVSILMRTHRTGQETQQGPIRLKNLLGEAAKKLKAAGHDDSILDRIASKPNEHGFWQRQGDGLAIYLTPTDCRMFRLDRQVEESVCVGNAFLVQPLIGESNSGGSYFVLSLSWDEAKLFHANGETLELIETGTLPAKFDELVPPSDPDESLQNTSHRSVGNSAGTSTAMFHGQGEGEDKIEADRDQYLSIVGGAVEAAIYNTGQPLVVVATSEVTGHFKATTKVEVTAKVDGSPSEWSDVEIREHAHQAIMPMLKSAHSEFGERFATAVASSKASDNLDDVLKAAQNGRVDSLMVCHQRNLLEQTNQVVIETLRTGGSVFQCNPESMPGNKATVAAIFRY